MAKTPVRPRIDGLMNDEAWKHASVFFEFRTMNPEPGLAPSEKTSVYLTYNQAEIFLGLVCHVNEPDRITTDSAGTDNPGSDDWIAFCLDTFQ